MTDGDGQVAGRDEDTALVERLREGDAEALNQLYLRHFPAVFGLAAALLGDVAAAEDVSQLTFLKAWERRAQIRRPQRFRAWLLTMARNQAIDQGRRREMAGGARASPTGVGVVSPEEVVVRDERVDLTRRAASSLRPRQREVLHLALIEGMSSREIGIVLGLPAGHAAVLVHRAKSALRHALRTLLVATAVRDCAQLQSLIPSGLRELSPGQHGTVDRHMRRCRNCQAAGERLTSADQLFGLALIPLPAGWQTHGLEAVSHGISRVGHAAVWGAGQARRLASQIAVTAVVVVTAAAAALPVRGPAPAVSKGAVAPPSGRIFVTGDDADVHAHVGPNADGARHVIQAGVRYVTRGRLKPRLLLVTDLRDPGDPLYGDPRLGIGDAGYAPDVADQGSGTAGVRDLHSVRLDAYDAIVVASDLGGWLRQDELDLLNARRADLSRYLARGGGIVAFAEGGAAALAKRVGLTSRGWYGFLPVTLGVTPVSQYEAGLVVSPAGAAMGLGFLDGTGNYLHAVLTPPPGATILESDGGGRVIAISMSVGDQKGRERQGP